MSHDRFFFISRTTMISTTIKALDFPDASTTRIRWKKLRAARFPYTHAVPLEFTVGRRHLTRAEDLVDMHSGSSSKHRLAYGHQSIELWEARLRCGGSVCSVLHIIASTGVGRNAKVQREDVQITAMEEL
jgi:hypothetical protein